MTHWQLLIVMILLKVPERYAISGDNFHNDPVTQVLLAIKERLRRGPSQGAAPWTMTMSALRHKSKPPSHASIENNVLGAADEEQQKDKQEGGFLQCLESRKDDFDRVDLPVVEAPIIQCASVALFGDSLKLFAIDNRNSTKEEVRNNAGSGWLDTFDRASKSYGVRIPFTRGLGLRMSRSTRDPDFIELTLDLDKGLYFNGSEEEFDDDQETTREELEIGRSGDGKQGRKKRRGNKGFFRRMVPLLAIPVLIQAAIVPMFLKMLSMMVFKSMVLGKLALFLVGFNNLRTRLEQTQEEVFHQNMAYSHYGYDGSPEWGSYVNGVQSRRRRR